jgi:hypothetical protein
MTSIGRASPYSIQLPACPAQVQQLCVYTAKNILERPGLLPSLERANGTRLFDPPTSQGWLNNKSLERWLEQDEARKAR